MEGKTTQCGFLKKDLLNMVSLSRAGMRSIQWDGIKGLSKDFTCYHATGIIYLYYYSLPSQPLQPQTRDLYAFHSQTGEINKLTHPNCNDHSFLHFVNITPRRSKTNFMAIYQSASRSKTFGNILKDRLHRIVFQLDEEQTKFGNSYASTSFFGEMDDDSMIKEVNCNPGPQSFSCTNDGDLLLFQKAYTPIIPLGGTEISQNMLIKTSSRKVLIRNLMACEKVAIQLDSYQEVLSKLKSCVENLPCRMRSQRGSYLYGLRENKFLFFFFNLGFEVSSNLRTRNNKVTVYYSNSRHFKDYLLSLLPEKLNQNLSTALEEDRDLKFESKMLWKDGQFYLIFTILCPSDQLLVALLTRIKEDKSETGGIGLELLDYFETTVNFDEDQDTVSSIEGEDLLIYKLKMVGGSNYVIACWISPLLKLVPAVEVFNIDFNNVHLCPRVTGSGVEVDLFYSDMFKLYLEVFKANN